MRSWKDVLDVFSTIAVLVAAGILIWSVLTTPGATPQERERLETLDKRIDPAMLTNVLGTGRIAIVEFTDFECPFCAKHAKETLPAIKRDLIDTGEVRYVVLNYPLEELHSRAFAAAEAVECGAQQGRYWQMHERLYGGADSLTQEAFIRLAKESGLPDLTRFEVCIAQRQTRTYLKNAASAV